MLTLLRILNTLLSDHKTKGSEPRMIKYAQRRVDGSIRLALSRTPRAILHAYVRENSALSPGAVIAALSLAKGW